MARYGKIDRRMWGDEAFRQLSKPHPNAQTLFIYLLTGPHVSNIPGVFSAGEAGLAEALGWPVKAFREAFRELSRKPLVKADWNARLVVIPNATRYNPPANPNVVKSWQATWDELPECSLKSEAYQHLKAFLEDIGEPFAKAFQEASRNPWPKPLPNQEQEQEQEQEEDPPTPHGGNGRAQAGLSGFEIFWRAYPKKRSKGQAERAWRKIQPDDVLLGVMLGKLDRARQTPDWTKEGGKFIPYPATWLNAKGWEDEYPANGSCSRPTRPSKVVL